MFFRRCWPVVGLVAAAILLVGAEPALAAWTTSGSGSVVAKAGQLTAPTPTIGTPACSSNKKSADVAVTFTGVPFANSYDLLWSTTDGVNTLTTVSPFVSGGTVTITRTSQITNVTLSVQLRSVRNSWQKVSSTVTKQFSC